MGLTINYEFRFGGTKQELQSKLEQIRQKCLDLPFEEVGEVFNKPIIQEQIDVWNENQWDKDYTVEQRDKALKAAGIDDTWLIVKTMSAKVIKKDNSVTVHRDELKHCDIVGLSLLAGEGCESSNLWFYKKTRQKYWIAKEYCKTQYATHFVRCHLLIVRLIDLVKESGIEVVKVDDEGDYYETRDINKLADNINDYTDLISSIFGSLKNNLPDGFVVLEAPIDKSKNYIKKSKSD